MGLVAGNPWQAFLTARQWKSLARSSTNMSKRTTFAISVAQAVLAAFKQKKAGVPSQPILWGKKWMLVPCGRPGRSLKEFTLKYGLLMDLFNKRQKAGERKLRQKYETYLSCRPAWSGGLECIYLQSWLHLSQEQFLFPWMVAGMELRIPEKPEAPIWLNTR